ncbi:MAG: type II toxin-antitoxin system VapC family toxin [Acidimicrobiia bacterium]
MTYLVDTDWVVHHLRGEETVVRTLSELAPEGLAVSILTLAELYEGVYAATDPRRADDALTEFLNPKIDVLGIDGETARLFGQERSRLRRSGRLIGDIDLLIACTGLRYQLTVLTNNRRHFSAVEGLAIRST